MLRWSSAAAATLLACSIAISTNDATAEGAELSAAIYSDFKDIAEDLVTEEVATKVDAFVLSHSAAAYYYLRKTTVPRLKAHNWAGLPEALRTDLSDLAADYVLWTLQRGVVIDVGEVSRRAEALLSEASLNEFTSCFTAAGANKDECRVLLEPIKDQKTLLLRACVSKLDAQPTLACDIALGIRSALAGESVATRHIMNFVADALVASAIERELLDSATSSLVTPQVRENVARWLGTRDFLTESKDLRELLDIDSLATSAASVKALTECKPDDVIRQIAEPDGAVSSKLCGYIVGDGIAGRTALTVNVTLKLTKDLKAPDITLMLKDIWEAPSFKALDPSVTPDKAPQYADTLTSAVYEAVTKKICASPTIDVKIKARFHCPNITAGDADAGTLQVAVGLGGKDGAVSLIEKRADGTFLPLRSEIASALLRINVAATPLATLAVTRRLTQLLLPGVPTKKTIDNEDNRRDLAQLFLVVRALTLGAQVHWHSFAKGGEVSLARLPLAELAGTVAGTLFSNSSARPELLRVQRSGTSFFGKLLSAGLARDHRELANVLLQQLLANALDSKDPALEKALRTFIVSFAGYVLDGSNAEQGVARQAFRVAAKDLLKQISNKGVPAPWKANAHVVPSLSLRFSANSQYIGEGGREGYRYVVTADWPTFLFAFGGPTGGHLGATLSVTDLLAWASEISLRRTAKYAGEGWLIADVFRPRVGLWTAIPQITEHLILSGTLGFRVVRLVDPKDPNADRAKSTDLEYKVGVSPDVSIAVTLLY